MKRHLNRIFSALALLISVTALCGCCACRKGSPVIGNLENCGWKLTELDNRKVSSNITVKFDPAAKVFTGVSRWGEIFAGYHLLEKERNIEFLNPGSRHTGGPDEEDRADTERLCVILNNTVNVKIDSHHLLMTDKNDDIIAIFEEIQ